MSFFLKVIRLFAWIGLAIIMMIAVEADMWNKSNRNPDSLRHIIMSDYFGFQAYHINLPRFSITSYKPRISNSHFKPSRYEYIIKFETPIDEAILEKMDSLVSVDKQEWFGGWSNIKATNEYCYCRFDIAKDFSDSICFNKNRMEARYIRNHY